MAKKEGRGKDEPKKVRKVGRPKKRGRKKKYYKPKIKGKSKSAKVKKAYAHNVTYNRVRQVIWENYKEDFPSYRVFIANKVDADGNKIKGSSIVSVVFRECKSLDCNDEDILAIYRQFRTQTKDEDVPLVPDSYFDPHGYWELITVNFWDGMDERLWVVSPMLLIDPDYFLGILGEDRYVNKDGEPINYDEYIKNEKQDFFYTEKGLADGFEIMNGKKVKEIVGYFEDENGDEDFEIIGFIYSTSGKDVSSYSEDDMYKTFYDALGI